MPFVNFFFFLQLFTRMLWTIEQVAIMFCQTSERIPRNTGKHSLKKSQSNRIITTDNTVASITGQRDRQSLFLRRLDKIKCVQWMVAINYLGKFTYRPIRVKTPSTLTFFQHVYSEFAFSGKKNTSSYCNQTRCHSLLQKCFGFLYKRVRTNGALAHTSIARSILESPKEYIENRNRNTIYLERTNDVWHEFSFVINDIVTEQREGPENGPTLQRDANSGARKQILSLVSFFSCRWFTAILFICYFPHGLHQ